MWVRNQRKINFLKEHGLLPMLDMFSEAYFVKSELLEELVFKYEIKYGCVPNKGMIPKKRFYNF